MQPESVVNAFLGLAGRLNRLSQENSDIITRAVTANPWFCTREISLAAKALADQMLSTEKLLPWLGRYGYASAPKNVAVVMAGNIPFAGFFDMLCILAAGHRCLIKYSSKDRVLMEFVAGELKRSCPDLPVAELAAGAAAPDAIIASGGDNAVRHLRYTYTDIPGLYRGNRASAAILTGEETDEQIAGLARDIFTYNGLGCRNVSHLIVPEGYDLTGLSTKLSEYGSSCVNPKYLNNFRQRRAVLDISGERYTAGTHFVLTESHEFPAALSEITCSRYTTDGQVRQWVVERESQLQCIVASREWEAVVPFAPVDFGRAQCPTLYDFPDRVDTMEFLSGL